MSDFYIRLRQLSPVRYDYVIVNECDYVPIVYKKLYFWIYKVNVRLLIF